jgi:hypothetical protein
LDLYRTVYSIYYAGELCKDVISWRVYYTSPILLSQISYYGTGGGECADGCFLIIIHEAAIALYIGTENSGEFALKTFICHMAPPLLRFQT